MLKKQYLTYFFHFPTLSTSKKCVPLHPKYDKRHLSNTAQGLCPSGRFFALPAMDSVVRPHRPRPGFLMGQPACHGDTILRGLAAREVSRLRPSRRHLVSQGIGLLRLHVLLRLHALRRGAVCLLPLPRQWRAGVDAAIQHQGP